MACVPDKIKRTEAVSEQLRKLGYAREHANIEGGRLVDEYLSSQFKIRKPTALPAHITAHMHINPGFPANMNNQDPGSSRSAPPTSTPAPSCDPAPDSNPQSAPKSAFNGFATTGASSSTWNPPVFSYTTPKKSAAASSLGSPASSGSPMDVDTPTPKKKTRSLLEQFNSAIDAGIDDPSSPTRSTIRIHSSPRPSVSAQDHHGAEGSQQHRNGVDSTEGEKDEAEGDDEGIFQLLILTGNWATKSMWWESVAEELLVRGLATRINCESNARACLEQCLQRNPNFEKTLMGAGIARMLTTVKGGGEPAVRRPHLDQKLWTMKQKGQMKYEGLIGPTILRRKGLAQHGPLSDESPLIEEKSLPFIKHTDSAKTTPQIKKIDWAKTTPPVEGKSLAKGAPLNENKAKWPLIENKLVAMEQHAPGASTSVDTVPSDENISSVNSTFMEEDAFMSGDTSRGENLGRAVVLVETNDNPFFSFRGGDEDSDL
ncbi:hypothetical protein Dda_1490 [Drechslerella dactyloides]|uniref:Uncharacterized protein n=1 Tax=Drechslerella dactyloides TaxID=74499 RepID=A0AAD6J699_DREDA|nr:hypothetical protein Dda_1490 [Drechslerella dactyloides]